MHASTLPAAFARRSPLLAFAVASLALHGAVLLGWHPSVNVPLMGGDTPSISVVMQSAATRPQHNSATETTVTKQTRVTTAHRIAVPQPRQAPVAPAPVQAQPEETPSTVAQNTTADDGSAQQQRLLGRIHAELLRYFRYPPLALRNGWQGTVLLGFRVNSRGDIEAIHIARSSGYSALDSAALGALRKVGHLAVETAPTTQSFDLQLPIVYRLEES